MLDLDLNMEPGMLYGTGSAEAKVAVPAVPFP
jgi:hypothetical protein